MKIPNKLKIGGFEWEIKENKEVAFEGNCFGSTHLPSQRIYIDPDSTMQKKEQTLIHEILHALWWQTGLTERYKKTPEIQEEIIQALGHGMYQVLKDNDLLK
jgi:hypothetical protein